MASLNTTTPRLKLNDGTSMPMLGYGTGTAWYKTGEESKTDQAVIDTVKTATKLGYTHLDGAQSTHHILSNLMIALT
jgi:diketogulonate reductase-like aldo/keto reductase